MMIDDLARSDWYRGLGPYFAFVFDRLRDPQTQWPLGRVEFRANDLWASVVRTPGRGAENAGFEYHRCFADLHLCLEGTERIGWRDSAGGLAVKTAFNPSDDFGLFAGTPREFATLSGGLFAIFFPGELHSPMIGEGELTKICVKIRVAPSV